MQASCMLSTKPVVLQEKKLRQWQWMTVQIFMASVCHFQIFEQIMRRNLGQSVSQTNKPDDVNTLSSNLLSMNGNSSPFHHSMTTNDVFYFTHTCSHQNSATAGVSISKISFLSNLETRVYKHVPPPSKPIQAQRQPQPQPQHRHTSSAASSKPLPQPQYVAQGDSSPVGDVSISDAAFLDFDIEGK